MDIKVFNVLIIITLIVLGIMILAATHDNSTQKVLRYAGAAFVLLGLTITTYVILGSLPIWAVVLFITLTAISIYGISNTTIDE